MIPTDKPYLLLFYICSEQDPELTQGKPNKYEEVVDSLRQISCEFLNTDSARDFQQELKILDL